MHMQESWHLVALDKPFSQRFSPLYSMAIDPKSLTPSMMSWVQNKNLSYTFALIFSVFVFLFLLFQVRAWSSSTLVHLHLHGPHLAHSLGLHQPSSYHRSWQRLVLGFINYPKTKLGLSTVLQHERLQLGTLKTPTMFCAGFTSGASNR